MAKQSSKKKVLKNKGKKRDLKKSRDKQPSKGCKSKQRKYDPSVLNAAVTAVSDGRISLRKASTTFGIPTTTIFRHQKDPEKVTWKKGPPTVFTETEEQEIVQWIQYRAERGFPINKTELLDCAQSFIRKLNRKTPFTEDRPGRHWYESFNRRHPILTERIPQHLTCMRAEVTQEDLKEWFTEIGQYLEKKNLLNICGTRIFNCDETNIMLCPKSDKVLTTKGARTVYKIVDAGEKESVTVLFTYSAEGARAPPMVLYKYVETIPKKIIEHFPSGWGIGNSESGWMTTETFYEYIANVFFPWLVQEKVDFPVVLYLDGHSSHVTMPLVTFCRQNHIELICSYPNATHILQPLDVAFFHAFKEQWRKTVPKWKNEFNVTRLNKPQFPAVLKMALEAMNEAKIIKNGFRTCGLLPFDPNAVDFNVLKKKKKVKQCSANVSKKNLFENVVPQDEQFVNTFENSLPLEILQLFREAQSDEIWAGDIEYTALFNYWLQLKKSKDDIRSKPIVKSVEILKNHSIIMLPELTDKSNDLNHTIDESQNPTEEAVHVIATEEIIDSSYENFSIDQENLFNSEIIVENYVNNNRLDLLDANDIEKNVKTYVVGQDGALIYQNDADSIPNVLKDLKTTSVDSCLSNKLTTDEPLNDSSEVNKENVSSISKPVAPSVTFKETFTLPVQYLPKKKRDKLKGKKKLPSAGTSDEWFAIHADKEKQKMVKEEKLAEKKRLQGQKKLLAEKKKQLDLEMRELTKRIKQEKV